MGGGQLHGPSTVAAVARTMLEAVVQLESVLWLHMKEKKPFQTPEASCMACPPQLWYVGIWSP